MKVIGKVLIMDDEEAMREMLTIMLDHIGHAVMVAADGEEAIELFRKAKQSGDDFDAVILDLTVRRGMGGKKAIEGLLEVDPEVKVIASSGFHCDPVMANYRDYGFRAVLCKPYQMAELKAVLQHLIGSQTNAAATPPGTPSPR